ncbi:MAG: ABC transporter permease [Actinobacteria bacterium]|nr:ABC transporter permease [Actinomycetota bacterium]
MDVGDTAHGVARQEAVRRMAGPRLALKLVWIEVKLFVREPITMMFTFLLPLLILVVLGGIFADRPLEDQYRNIPMMDYYVPAYMALVLASLGTISLPVHLANYRERGVLRRFRASGMQEWALLVSQTLVSLVIAVIGSVLLFALGVLAFDAGMAKGSGDVAVTFTIGAFTFSALGMLLGSVLPTARAAQAVGMLLWFVMMFLSGTDGPLDLMPAWLLNIGKALPLYHLVLPMVDAWNGFGINVLHTLITVAVGVAAAALTFRLFRWD